MSYNRCGWLMLLNRLNRIGWFWWILNRLKILLSFRSRFFWLMNRICSWFLLTSRFLFGQRPIILMMIGLPNACLTIFIIFLFWILFNRFLLGRFSYFGNWWWLVFLSEITRIRSFFLNTFWFLIFLDILFRFIVTCSLSLWNWLQYFTATYKFLWRFLLWYFWIIASVGCAIWKQIISLLNCIQISPS